MFDTRRWSLRRHVGVAFVTVAVVSIAIVGVLGYTAARSLLTDEMKAQLQGLQHARTQAIELGVKRYRARMSSLASDRAVVEAVRAFDDAVDELDDTAALDASQSEAVDDYYAALLDDTELADSIHSAGLDVPPLADAVPSSDAARYLQFHYVVNGDGAATVDAGDGSAYSAVHARFHPFLSGATSSILLDDLLIVPIGSGRVAYSVAKNVDLGADVVDGPLGANGLSSVLTEELTRARAGETVMVDFAPYLGAGGAPVLFAATQVRDGNEIVGAIVGEVPIDQVNALMTADRRWADIGLGDTGETYLVGSDRLLRSDSRLWLEDPDDYLEKAASAESDDDSVAAIAGTGSAVLLQEVDTEPVASALGGDTFVGSTSNYLGQRTLSVAARVDLPGLDWVVVADLGASEANDPLNSYVRRVLIAAAVLLPLVVLISVWLARRLARPIAPLATAAASVASGDRDPIIDDVSGDELGHLGKELRRFCDALATEEARLAAAEHEIDEMLLAIMPPRAVEPVRRGELELSDWFDSATIVVLTLADEDSQVARSVIHQMSELDDEIETLAREQAVERVHISGDRHVFVAGVGQDGYHADAALRFAVAARDAVTRFATSSGVDVTAHAVLSAGNLTMGVVGGRQLSFGVWGEPVRRALELDAVARNGQILMDATVTDRLDGDWRFAPVDRPFTLGGQPVDAAELLTPAYAAEGRSQ